MKEFTNLCEELNQTEESSSKRLAFKKYMSHASNQDILWTIELLTGKWSTRILTTKELVPLCINFANIPGWLFDECSNPRYDLLEIINAALPITDTYEDYRLNECMKMLLKIKNRKHIDSFIVNTWKRLTTDQRLIFNRIITGRFNVRLNQKIIASVIAKETGKDQYKIAHILQSQNQLYDSEFEELFCKKSDSAIDKPFPFQLLETHHEALGKLGRPDHWQAEWKWQGIRCQIIKYKGQLYIWNTKEELLNSLFPEFQRIKDMPTDDFVIEGIIMILNNGKIAPPGILEKRLKRKRVTEKIKSDFPAVFFSYDIHKIGETELHELSLVKRRVYLDGLIRSISAHVSEIFFLSDAVNFKNWTDLKNKMTSFKTYQADGLILKLKKGNYYNQDDSNTWKVFKIKKSKIKVVLLYAHRGQGPTANDYVAFSFGIRKRNDELVPLLKTDVLLSSENYLEITNFIKENTIERFGPTRSVLAQLVFQISFSSVELSSRRKSGIVLRDAQMEKWLKNATVNNLSYLEDLKKMIEE